MLKLLTPLNRQLISEPEQLAMKIEMEATDGQPQRDFLEANINEWLSSFRYKRMVEAQRYYENENEILKRERTVIGRNGEMVKAPYLANNKLPHAFMRKLTKQKIGYLLSKPFAVTSDDENFAKALADYIDKNFYRLFKNGGQEAIIKGIGWLQPYYDEEGTLRFKRIPSTEIIPFWKDIDHTILEAAIRIYDVEVYTGQEKSIVQHVKFFTPEVIYNYMRDKDGLVPDPEAPIEYNFQVQLPVEATEENPEPTAQTENVMWGRIPLIPLKYNVEEDSLLKYVKPLIDDYDRRTSDASNTLEDEPNKIKVVKDYDGTDKGEFVYNLAKYRTLFLRGTGEVTTLDATVDHTALDTHLERTRRDIYEFGGGVDTQHKEIGNATGVALKFIYADLDSDCSDFAAELSWAVEQICWFIKQDMILKGIGDFTEASVDTTFNTDISINETETIDNISKSVGLVSNKTLLKNHPFVDDVAEEEKQIAIEQEEAMKRTEAELALTNGALTTSGAPNSDTPPATQNQQRTNDNPPSDTE